MANTKLWLGQWECVLQERDPAPSTAPCCNLLPHKDHSSQEQRQISSETLAHFRFGGSFLQVQLQHSNLVAGEEQQSLALLSGPSAQNLKALLQTQIPSSKQNLTLHGFLACWKAIASAVLCVWETGAPQNIQLLLTHRRNQGSDSPEPGAITTHPLFQ